MELRLPHLIELNEAFVDAVITARDVVGLPIDAVRLGLYERRLAVAEGKDAQLGVLDALLFCEEFVGTAPLMEGLTLSDDANAAAGHAEVMESLRWRWEEGAAEFTAMKRPEIDAMIQASENMFNGIIAVGEAYARVSREAQVMIAKEQVGKLSERDADNTAMSPTRKKVKTGHKKTTGPKLD